MPLKSKVIRHGNRLALFLVAVLLIAATGARADTIVYNSFGPGFTITPEGITGGFTIGPPGTTEFFGAPFSPTSAVDLTSFTASLDAGLNVMFPLTTTSLITVSVWSGSSSEPSTKLESWPLTVNELATNYTLTSVTHPLLIPGDTYWVVEGYTNGVDNNNALGWGVNTAATTLGLWESETSPTSLALFRGPQPALEVQGTPAAVPEPSALLFLAVGFLCVFVKRRMA